MGIELIMDQFEKMKNKLPVKRRVDHFVDGYFTAKKSLSNSRTD